MARINSFSLVFFLRTDELTLCFLSIVNLLCMLTGFWLLVNPENIDQLKIFRCLHPSILLSTAFLPGQLGEHQQFCYNDK